MREKGYRIYSMIIREDDLPGKALGYLNNKEDQYIAKLKLWYSYLNGLTSMNEITRIAREINELEGKLREVLIFKRNILYN